MIIGYGHTLFRRISQQFRLLSLLSPQSGLFDFFHLNAAANMSSDAAVMEKTVEVCAHPYLLCEVAA